MSRKLDTCAMVERSLIKKYRKTLWNPFIAAVKRYELISPGDRIAVCISGGKDSMLLAKLMQELHRHTEQPFQLVFLVMDPGYNPENRALIEENAASAPAMLVTPSSAPPLSRRSLPCFPSHMTFTPFPAAAAP